MKKRVLLLLTTLAFIMGVMPFGAHAAASMESFAEVSAPSSDDMVTSTTWNYETAWGLTDPVGEWHIDDFTEARYNQNQAGMFMDNDNAVAILEFKDSDLEGVEVISEIVFADLYTIDGLGDQGATTATPEDFERIRLVYSDDAQNWTEATYTVAYHKQAGEIPTSQGGTKHLDLYWHLILDTPVKAKYWAINTSESTAWDAHTPTFGIFLRFEQFYGVRGVAGATEAPATTEVPATTEAEETTGMGAPSTADMGIVAAVLAVAIAGAGAVLCLIKKRA